jgi:hypothetical protein
MRRSFFSVFFLPPSFHPLLPSLDLVLRLLRRRAAPASKAVMISPPNGCRHGRRVTGMRTCPVPDKKRTPGQEKDTHSPPRRNVDDKKTPKCGCPVPPGVPYLRVPYLRVPYLRVRIPYLRVRTSGCPVPPRTYLPRTSLPVPPSRNVGVPYLPAKCGCPVPSRTFRVSRTFRYLPPYLPRVPSAPEMWVPRTFRTFRTFRAYRRTFRTFLPYLPEMWVSRTSPSRTSPCRTSAAVPLLFPYLWLGVPYLAYLCTSTGCPVPLPYLYLP